MALPPRLALTVVAVSPSAFLALGVQVRPALAWSASRGAGRRLTGRLPWKPDPAGAPDPSARRQSAAARVARGATWTPSPPLPASW